MAKRTTKVARKKVSGPNIEDWQRNTERLTLRLDPESMQALEEFSKEMGCTKATVVLLALEALEVLRQDKGLPMNGWGTRTPLGMEMLKRAAVTVPKCTTEEALAVVKAGRK